jgi:hypothetical protein
LIHNTRRSHVKGALKASARALERPVVMLVEKSRHRIRYRGGRARHPLSQQSRGGPHAHGPIASWPMAKG